MNIFPIKLNNLQRQKLLTPCLLLLVVFFAFTPHYYVHALEDPGQAPVSPQSSGVGSFIAGQAVKMVNEVVYLFIGASAYIFSLSASVFAKAIEYALNPLFKVGIIIEVWTIFRDIANVFFIFILLIIAIATILRLESYGIKRLLPTLIIVALFINFSLLATQYVIYPANWLSQDVFNSIITNGSLADQLGGAFHIQSAAAISSQGDSPLWGGSGVVGSATVGCAIGAIFFVVGCLGGAAVGAIAHFLVTSITASSNAGIADQAKIFAYGVSVLAVNVVAAFTLLAGAIMVVARTGILMLLMMVSPLAFLAHAVPGAQGYARKWWSTLLSQSFFLPVYLIFIYVAISISDTVSLALTQNNTNLNLVENPEMLYFYIIVVIIFIAGLIFARQMGAYGAGLAIRYGQKSYRAAGGYAGRMALRSTVAPVAERLKESRIAKTVMTTLPRTGAALAAGLQKASEAGGRQKIAEQRAAQLTAMLSPQEQARAFTKMAKREQDAMLAKKNAREIEEMRKRTLAGSTERMALDQGISRLGSAKQAQTIIRRDMDEIKAAWDSGNDDLRQNIINETQRETLQNLANKFNTDPEREAFVRQVNSLNPERIGDVLSVLPAQFAAAGRRADEVASKVDIAKLSPTYARDHQTEMLELAKHMNSRQFLAAAQEGGEVEEAINKQVRRLGASLADVADALDTAARAVPGALPTTPSKTGQWIRQNTGPRGAAARVFGP